MIGLIPFRNVDMFQDITVLSLNSLASMTDDMYLLRTSPSYFMLLHLENYTGPFREPFVFLSEEGSRSETSPIHFSRGAAWPVGPILCLPSYYFSLNIL